MASPSPQNNDHSKGKGKEKKKYLLESETKAENSTPEKTKMTTTAAGSSVQRTKPNAQLTRVFTNPIMGTMGNMSCL